MPGAGLYGWVGYDGDFVLGHYEQVLAYDHDCDLWFDTGDLSRFLPADLPEPAGSSPKLDFCAQTTMAEFMAAVSRAQNYISAGDIYQVNLAHEWLAEWPLRADPLTLYHRLRTVSPAPYAAYLDLDGVRVLSSSPECFLRMEGRRIVTRPIKGTRPRFPLDEKRDENSAHELASSPKERAELLMITDLERNDLGMVCEYGSVRVPELAAVEKYAQVFHLVSTVTGELRSGIDHAMAFQAAFPGGSITGAPKNALVRSLRN
jgi:anthranilate/para-aminobenzoate synthase component I